jgi:hypothetical protein
MKGSLMRSLASRPSRPSLLALAGTAMIGITSSAPSPAGLLQPSSISRITRIDLARIGFNAIASIRTSPIPSICSEISNMIARINSIPSIDAPCMSIDINLNSPTQAGISTIASITAADAAQEIA